VQDNSNGPWSFHACSIFLDSDGIDQRRVIAFELKQHSRQLY
jgi:hypothetical protein